MIRQNQKNSLLGLIAFFHFTRPLNNTIKNYAPDFLVIFVCGLNMLALFPLLFLFTITFVGLHHAISRRCIWKRRPLCLCKFFDDRIENRQQKHSGKKLCLPTLSMLARNTEFDYGNSAWIQFEFPLVRFDVFPYKHWLTVQTINSTTFSRLHLIDFLSHKLLLVSVRIFFSSISFFFPLKRNNFDFFRELSFLLFFFSMWNSFAVW